MNELARAGHHADVVAIGQRETERLMPFAARSNRIKLELSVICGEYFHSLVRLERLDEALAQAEVRRNLLKELKLLNPADKVIRQNYVVACSSIVFCLSRLNRDLDSVPYALEAIDVARSMIDRGAGDNRILISLASRYVPWLMSHQRADEAIQVLDRIASGPSAADKSSFVATARTPAKARLPKMDPRKSVSHCRTN
jgi:hypothetical protein